jgi:branched-chain amino acid transport system permease protein
MQFIGVLLDGIAYASLLFIISAGLSITMGLMQFANLAHGAFAMVGGYACVYGMNALGIPYLATLPLAFLIAGAFGLVLELALYRRLYAASHLTQVLFTVGVLNVSAASAVFLFGAGSQPIHLPLYLQGQIAFLGANISTFRLFTVVLVVAMAALLASIVQFTRFGARLRCAVDNRRAAIGMGINVDRLMTIAFTFGSALAGLGGALGVQFLGLDPSFAFKYLVYFLLVVVVGGAGSFVGPLLAALIVGIVDTASRYYVPETGSFTLYLLMVALLVMFPNGLYGRAR